MEIFLLISCNSTLTIIKREKKKEKGKKKRESLFFEQRGKGARLFRKILPLLSGGDFLKNLGWALQPQP
jgi:hypothetical protein